MPTFPHYEFTELLGNAVSSVLDSGQSVVTTSAILQNREDAEVVLPRLEVDVSNVARASDQMMRRSDAWDYPVRHAYNHYRADLLLTIGTDRVEGSIDHANLVGQVRYLMAREAQSFVSPVVTLFEVLHLEETGASQAVDNDAREDTTVLAYAMDFALTQAAVSPTLSSVTAPASVSWLINDYTGLWSLTWTAVSGLTLQVSTRASGADWAGTPTPSLDSNLGTYTSITANAFAAGTYEARVRYFDGASAGPWTSIFSDSTSPLEIPQNWEAAFEATVAHTWTPPENPSGLQIEFHRREIGEAWTGSPYATVNANYLDGFYSSGFSAGDWEVRVRYKQTGTSNYGLYTDSVTGTIVTP